MSRNQRKKNEEKVKLRKFYDQLYGVQKLVYTPGIGIHVIWVVDDEGKRHTPWYTYNV